MSTGAVKYEPGSGKRGSQAQIGGKPALGRKMAAVGLKPEERELIKVTLEAVDEWVESNRNFEQVHEELLVDYYTYRIKACEARYTYYLKLVKEKGLARYL